MTTTWYKTEVYNDRITEVEVSRATSSCVWVNGRQFRIASSYDTYWPTWEQAHASLRASAIGNIEALKAKLQKERARLGSIEGMRQEVTC